MAKLGVRNALAQWRAKRGIGPAELAAQVGISRQTVYAIETGAYVPNTSVSLRLARVLAASVEDIFQLEQEESPSIESAEAIILGDANALAPGQPLRLCQVDDRLIALPPDPGSWGLPATDAILLSASVSQRTVARVQIVGEDWKNSSRILLAGCDPTASILAGAVQRQGCEAILEYENSSRALALLRQGLVHVAGTHLLESPADRADLSSLVGMFSRDPVAVFSYATWREGLVVPHGNPKKILGVADLARPDVTIANREPGAGCRQLLDGLLQAAAISANAVRGYERTVPGQLPVARLVQSGEVDCCVCAESAARSLGLDFVPLADKPYRMVVHRRHLDLRPVQVLLQTLGRLSFRREVEASAGYDMRCSGERLV